MFSDAPIGVRPAPPAARRRSEETWAAAKAAYLGGQSGPEVCERFDVGLSALRQRAASEAWRRADQVDPAPGERSARGIAPEAPPEALDDDPPLSSAEMAELTRKRARRAMLEGRVRDAQSWTGVHERWRRLAAEEAEAARRLAAAARTPDQVFADRVAQRDEDDRLDALLLADLKARASVESAGALDEVHEVHDLNAPAETTTARKPLNRRRRRALARLDALMARQASRGGP